MRLKSTLSFILLSIVLFSCTKTEIKRSPEEILAKVWSIPIDDIEIDTTSSLAFNKDKTFIRIHQNTDTLFGRWELKENELIVYSVPAKTSLGVDSVVSETDGYGKNTLRFFTQNTEILTVKDGKYFPKEESITFNIERLTQDSLILSLGEGMAETFIYKAEELTSGISFYGVFRGAIGILSLLFIAWLFSINRAAINWSLVGKGLLIQFALAIAVLYIPQVEAGFEFVAEQFTKLINSTTEGVNFVFGQFGKGPNNSSMLQAPLISFAFVVLPTIIFFSALMSILYYIGLLQLVVKAFAWVMQRIMKLSGAESLAAAGNIFLGQTESPLLIKPYLGKMTKSELMTLMTGGMATIAGGVLAAYIGFLGGDDPVQQAFFAKHLLTASVMSAPAAVVAAKMLVPETEDFSKDLTISKEKLGANVLEAISNGTTDGLKLAVNVGAMLLVFTALMYLLNNILWGLGDVFSLNQWVAEVTHGQYTELSFQFIIGYTFAPISWLMGVDNWNDMVLTGQLLGEKTILNEFYAYSTFGTIKSQFISEKAIVMSTYMLCGFANFASIGIQIGGIGALIPSRKGLLSQLGVRALIGGTLACLFTAVIVGMLM